MHEEFVTRLHFHFRQTVDVRGTIRRCSDQLRFATAVVRKGLIEQVVAVVVVDLHIRHEDSGNAARAEAGDLKICRRFTECFIWVPLGLLALAASSRTSAGQRSRVVSGRRLLQWATSHRSHFCRLGKRRTCPQAWGHC